jgi:hypothetical protein
VGDYDRTRGASDSPGIPLSMIEVRSGAEWGQVVKTIADVAAFRISGHWGHGFGGLEIGHRNASILPVLR